MTAETEPISKNVRKVQLGPTQKMLLEMISESLSCMRKYIGDTIGNNQGQVARALDRPVLIGLVVKRNNTTMAHMIKFMLEEKEAFYPTFLLCLCNVLCIFINI